MTVFIDKAPAIMRDLMNTFGLDELSAAAILGNLGHESGGFKFLQEKKPLVPGSRGGYGWAQWTGPRRRAYEAWCAAKGLDPAGDEANFSFLVHELQTSEAKAIPAVKAAVGLEAKVRAFEAAFERAGVKHYPGRYAYAAQAYTAFTGNPITVSAPTPPKRPKTVTAPRVWAETELASFEVEAIQKRLRDLGYYQVGKVDGKWGPSTAGALIAMQTQAGITADGHWGPQSKEALASDANKRVIPEARANTTAKDLRAQGSIIAIEGNRVTWSSIWSILLSAASVAQYVAQNWSGDLSSLPWPISMVANFLPPWAMIVAVIGLNIYNGLAAKGIVQARVVAEQTGLHNGEPDPAPSPPVTRAPDGPSLGGLLGSLFNRK